MVSEQIHSIKEQKKKKRQAIKNTGKPKKKDYILFVSSKRKWK